MRKGVLSILSISVVFIAFAGAVEAAKITIEKPPVFSAGGDYIGHEEIDPLLLDQLGFTVIADYETYLVGEVEEADLDRFQTTATTRGMTHEVRRDFDEIRVNKYSFSSFGQPADLPRDLTIDRYDGPTSLFLVQLKAPLTTEWHNEITSAGDIIGYLPENTFIVRTATDADVRLADLPGVQHVSIHQPAYKVRRTLLNTDEPVTVDIQFDGEQSLDDVAELLRNQTSQEVIIETGKPFSYARTTLTQENIAFLAQRPEVFWIDRALLIEFSGERQATTTAGLYDQNGERPVRYTPDGHHGWILSKNFCTPTEAPEGCWPYWTKIGMIDSGLDENVCQSGYDENTGVCGTWQTQLFHQDLNHVSNLPGPCGTNSMGPEAAGDCDDPVIRDQWFCADNIADINQCFESGTEYRFTDDAFGSTTWAPGHGTATTAVIVGDPLSIVGDDPDPPETDSHGFLRGAGLAPSAQIVVGRLTEQHYPGDLGTTGMGPAEYNELIGKIFRLGGNTCNELTSQYVRFTNNSWNLKNYHGTGEYVEAYDYTAFSQMADMLVRDGCLDFDDPKSDMTVVFSAGNHEQNYFSYGSWVTSPANAKNVISVGASRGWVEQDGWAHQRCEYPPLNPDPIDPDPQIEPQVIGDIAGGVDVYGPNYSGILWHSRRGFIEEAGVGSELPRFKPDLVAPGTQCVGARSSYFGADPVHDDWYRCAVGTSVAAPAVAAASILTDAWYYYKISGESATPSPAMVKALLVAHADNLSGGEDWITYPNNTPIPHSPSIAQGWGRANLDKLFHDPPLGGDNIEELVWDQDRRKLGANRRFTFSGQNWKKQLQIDDSTKDIIAVLVYTDRYADLPATDLTVNNLDLTIFTNDFVQGKSFWGNRFDTGSWYSKDYGGATWTYVGDTVNTVEVIRIESGELTQPFWIRVGARNISMKAVPGQDGASPNQDFALYVYNVQEAP